MAFPLGESFFVLGPQVDLPMFDGNMGLVLDVVDATRGPMISKVP